MYIVDERHAGELIQIQVALRDGCLAAAAVYVTDLLRATARMRTEYEKSVHVSAWRLLVRIIAAQRRHK